MIVSAKGFKGLLIGVGVIFIIIIVLILALNILIILLPIIILITIIGYIARKIYYLKKQATKETRKEVITVKYKVKGEHKK